MKKIKADLILFDLGDIFFNAHKWRLWLYRELKRMKKISGNFRDFYFLYEEKIKDVYLGKIDYQSAFITFLQTYGVKNINKFYHKSIKVKELYENKRRLYKGVKKTIENLKKRNKTLIVVTDNEKSGDVLYYYFSKKYYFFKYIDNVISSIDLGVTKSEVDFFEITLKMAKFQRNETVFVGHDKDEIETAKKLNIQTIVYNNYLKLNFINSISIRKFNQLDTIIE